MQDREGRSGTVIAGVFLIGLGLIFLFRDQLNISWDLIWPFFLIVPGVYTLFRAFLPGDPGQRVGGVIGGAILLFLGGVFLLRNYVELDWGKIWPFFLIIPGAGLLLGALLGSGRRGADRWPGGSAPPGGPTASGDSSGGSGSPTP